MERIKCAIVKFAFCPCLQLKYCSLLSLVVSHIGSHQPLDKVSVYTFVLSMEEGNSMYIYLASAVH